MFTLHKVQFDRSSIQGEVARAYRFPIGLSRRFSALKFARMVPSSENHPSLPHFHNLESYCTSLANVEIVWGVKDPILGKQLKRVKEIVGNARITEVSAGHFLQEESYKEISSAIKSACRAT